MSKFISVLVAALVFASCTKKKEEDVYVMGFTPAESAETVMTNGNVITDIIKKKTGIKIKAYVASDYTALIEALRGGTVHFAWLAPFGLVLAEKRAGAKVLLKSVRNGKPYFYSCIFVRSDKPYKTIQDLKGRNIAWVDPASASGFIVPKASLINDGIEVDKFFGKQIFAGGHDSVLLGVMNGSVDAGATFTNDPDGQSGPWNMLNASKPEFKDKVKVIYVSKPIPNDTFSTSDKFNADHADIVEKVTNVIKDMDKEPEGKKALHDLYRIDGMIPAKSEEFEVLRKAATKLDVEVGKKK